MFRFVCPMCQHGMEVSERKAGSKTRCQRCGQKLLIPMPPQNSYGKKKRKGAGPGGLRRYSRQIVGAALLLGVGIGGYQFIYLPIAEGSAGRIMEVRDYARNSPERAVRDTLAKNLIRPKLLKFIKWGPHLYRREWESLLRLADASNREAAEKAVKMKSFECIVRVVYEIPETAVVSGTVGQYASGNHDHLFAVKGQYIAMLDGVPSGDDWKDRFEKTFLRNTSAGDSSSDKKGR